MSDDFARLMREKEKAPFLSVPAGKPEIPIETNIDVIRSEVENLTGKSIDVVLHNFMFGGIRGLSLMCDGMCNSELITQSILLPIKKVTDGDVRDVEGNYLSGGDLLTFVKENLVTETDIKEVKNLGDAIEGAMIGMFVIFFDSCDSALMFSVQGFKIRGVDEPVSEAQERGAREGFTESYKVNMTMIRRRLRTADLRFEQMKLGVNGNNIVTLCYMDGRVDQSVLAAVKERLKSADFDMVLSSGYLQPYLDTEHTSFFTGVGVTERPDVSCAKIGEGKIVLLVDGTPFALYVPHVFVETIHSFDDYANRPFYTTFIRFLKFASFVISVTLPGIYVSLAIFHQELFPEDMFFTILSTELKTPFPIMPEALTIHLIFEVMREAGLRLPKTIGHAVSIVGALVIGEAAVTAGLVAAPMLIIVALTAISSFVLPEIYNSVAILRLVFIVIGGLLGMYGIILGLLVLTVNMTAINPYGVPYTSPVAPLVVPAFRDLVYRQGWKKLSKKIQINETLEQEVL